MKYLEYFNNVNETKFRLLNQFDFCDFIRSCWVIINENHFFEIESNLDRAYDKKFLSVGLSDKKPLRTLNVIFKDGSHIPLTSLTASRVYRLYIDLYNKLSTYEFQKEFIEKNPYRIGDLLKLKASDNTMSKSNIEIHPNIEKEYDWFFNATDIGLL